MSVVRVAFFQGRVKPGCEAEFDAYLERELAPLWRSFPHLSAFRMMRNCHSDDGAPPHALILSFTYPSHEAMAEALASPTRMRSREVTKGLFAFFEGQISHIVADARDLATLAGPEA